MIRPLVTFGLGEKLRELLKDPEVAKKPAAKALASSAGLRALHEVKAASEDEAASAGAQPESAELSK